MRPSQRLIAAAVLIALSSALAGCSSLYSWDPSDVFDWLDTKKKLPGERKPVFPDGVPGLEQGVPKELYKGNVEQQQQEQAAQAAAAAAAPHRRRRSRSRSTPRNPRARASRRPRPPPSRRRARSRRRSPRRTARPPPRRRLRNRRRSSASAPPRRRPIKPTRNRCSRPGPRRARSSRNHRRRHSRRRCRAVRSRADFVLQLDRLRIDSIICAYFTGDEVSAICDKPDCCATLVLIDKRA